MRDRFWLLALSLVLIAGLGAFPADAGEVENNFPFELDRWYELEVTDGPVTLHRVRVKKDTRAVRKSQIFRPGNSPYAETVVIELEYSNSSDDDWDARVKIDWRDAQGRAIDGYDGEEGLDEDERHETTTMTLATLKYGLEVAKDLYVKVSFERE